MKFTISKGTMRFLIDLLYMFKHSDQYDASDIYKKMLGRLREGEYDNEYDWKEKK